MGNTLWNFTLHVRNGEQPWQEASFFVKGSNEARAKTRAIREAMKSFDAVDNAPVRIDRPDVVSKGIKRIPFYGDQGQPRCCYACDEKPVGFRDLRPEGGKLERACSRHADPKVRVYNACMYCSGPVRKGSLIIDGDFVHASCYNNDALH